MIAKVPRLNRGGIALLSVAALLVLAACGSSATPTSQSPIGSPDPTRPGDTPTLTPTPTSTAPQVTPTPTGDLSTATPTPIPTRPAPVIDLNAVPDVDVSIHSVPLEDVWFDTFGQGLAIRLSRITPERRKSLRDILKPIYDPVYGPPDSLPWLEDRDLVVGYETESGAYAYPIGVLNFRELVNDVIDGVPVLITFCPLCASGVIFDRRLDGQTLLFGNTSALYQSDLVMYDHQTGSYWHQTGGEAIVGTLTDKRLKPLPGVTIPWGRWKESYPDTKLLIKASRDEPVFDELFGREPFRGNEQPINVDIFPYPVDRDKLDHRISSAEIVVTVEVDSSIKAYPLALIGDGAIMDEIGGEPIVVFSQDNGKSGGAYLATVNGQVLNFQFTGGFFIDEETGSLWNFGGLAVEGRLEGTKLERLPSRRAFWFSIAISFPGIDLYLPEDN